ncbi:MAG: cytochrome C [SAR86 cluster bacterium]|uniref:Cytochrome C n=1 Tax=SAR86 cluster bacterium TaxID=2030880 RepID=A0A2A5C7C1_9GAMM|nr:cytochrome c [Gammaproteobacteria bacterium AH-315-E17]PCJ39370.1 MAG: cytochrome C [SAR86 cluster bacterium]
MFTRKFIVTLCCGLSLIFVQNLAAQEGPGLGVPITEEDLAPWDISIETDGSGLPPGSGTAQAGESIYIAQCLACHGVEGEGQPYDRLVGGHGTLDQLDQVRTVGSFWPYATTVFDYIRRAMPFNTPQTLSDDDIYALTAYLFYLNGIIDQDDILDASSLAEIEMPNADGFILGYPL